MDEDMIYYDDDDDIMDGGYMEQQMYEQYLAAAARGQEYRFPERVPFLDQFRRCLEGLMFERGDNGMTTFMELGLLMGSCLLVLFTSCLTFLPRYVVPWTSLICGSYAVYAFFGQNSMAVYLIFGFAAAIYVFMFCIHTIMRRNGLAWRVGGLCFTVFFIMQFLVQQKTFLQIRGILMIMTMKVFSLASDIESNQLLPNPLDFFSYCLGVSSVMFGPWMPYEEHALIMKQKQFRSILNTIWQGICSFIIAVMTLLVSSCFVEWLIPDDYESYSIWLIAFRDAISFRYSHYFICYMAEGSLYFSGYLANPVEDDQAEDGNGNGQAQNYGIGRDVRIFGRHIHRALSDGDNEFPVTNPLYVEFPRSLVDVVVNWNIPMHAWLKRHVFTPTKEDNGYFAAILLTFAVSALLHGFNFQISAVLLSLGIYTYAEHTLRETLARAFNACIRSRRCRSGCGHSNDSWNLWVMVANLLFFLLAMFHLTYLGMVFDSSDSQEVGYNVTHTLGKWSKLNFASHYVALGTLTFAKVI